MPCGLPIVAVYFLLHFLAGCPGWVLPTALLYGARTFLGTVTTRKLRPQRDRLADPFTVQLKPLALSHTTWVSQRN